jgi:hypothetical protein
MTVIALVGGFVFGWLIRGFYERQQGEPGRGKA